MFNREIKVTQEMNLSKILGINKERYIDSLGLGALGTGAYTSIQETGTLQLIKKKKERKIKAYKHVYRAFKFHATIERTMKL